MIDSQGVAVMEMIVEHRGEEIVSAGDGVEIAGEMQVDVLHRNHLRVSTPSSPAFATAGHYTLTRAFAAAPLTVTQPVGFVQLVWAALLGMALFGEALDPFVFLGGGIVVAAVTYISHREAAAARRMRTPPAVATRV